MAGPLPRVGRELNSNSFGLSFAPRRGNWKARPMSRTAAFPGSAALLLVLSLAGPAAAQKSDKALPAYQSLIRGTAVIVSLDAWDKPCSMGTGWLADRDQKLLVTNYHVVGSGAKARILFPVYFHGELVTDRNFYMEQLVQGNSSAARVLLRHKRTDQAILQLDAIPEFA